MGDDNLIRTLGDYSKPNHESYRNTIELPVGNNMVPLRFNTIRWCKTDAHSTDFGSRIQTNTSRISLNLWTHLTLMVKIGKEHAYVYFNFPYAIKLAIGLNVFQQDPSPHGRILLHVSLFSSFHQKGPQKLRNDILMFQQHHGESLSEAWTRFKDLLRKVPHHGIDLWLQVKIFYDGIDHTLQRTVDYTTGGRLRKLSGGKSWATIEELA
ncbi:zinc finger, CCHC-type containing protein [Tanacetum coccineum]